MREMKTKKGIWAIPLGNNVYDLIDLDKCDPDCCFKSYVASKTEAIHRHKPHSTNDDEPFFPM